MRKTATAIGITGTLITLITIVTKIPAMISSGATAIAMNTGDFMTVTGQAGSLARCAFVLHLTYFTYQNYRYGIDQKDAVVARISAYYNDQIEQVVNDCTLSRWEKRDAIDNLTAQKTATINNIYSQCGDAGQYPGQY